MKLYFLIITSMSQLIFAYNKHHVKGVTQPKVTKLPINAAGCDFRGSLTLLQKVDFTGANLVNALFSSNDSTVMPAPGTVKIPNQLTDLTGVQFVGATLASTSFRNTILKNANFTKADLRYADFSGADLTGAIFDGAQNVSLARFCQATMPDGTKCAKGSWKNKAGKLFPCNCPS